MTMARRLLLVLASALAFAGTAAGAQSPPATLSVVSFNVLAPVWAAPVWYPSDMDMSLLDAAYRRDRISTFLASQARAACYRTRPFSGTSNRIRCWPILS